MISIQATDTTITNLAAPTGGSIQTCFLPASGGTLLVSTIKDVMVSIPSAVTSYNATVYDANAYPANRINAFANGTTTGGVLGGDEIEMTPLIVSAYCINSGTVNIVVSSSSGPIVGTYGISYTIQ